MNNEQGFLDAIAENPEDDTNRLVYADWLEERDDIRGEYLRLECALPKMLASYDELKAKIDRDWRLAVSGRKYLVLREYPPDRKITMIKLVREFTSCGLKEAKDLVESREPILLDDLSVEDAERFAQRFTEYGANIGILPERRS